MTTYWYWPFTRHHFTPNLSPTLQHHIKHRHTRQHQLLTIIIINHPLQLPSCHRLLMRLQAEMLLEIRSRSEALPARLTPKRHCIAMRLRMLPQVERPEKRAVALVALERPLARMRRSAMLLHLIAIVEALIAHATALAANAVHLRLMIRQTASGGKRAAPCIVRTKLARIRPLASVTPLVRHHCAARSNLQSARGATIARLLMPSAKVFAQVLAMRKRHAAFTTAMYERWCVKICVLP